MQQVIEKLVAAGIELIPAAQINTHFLFQRDGFVCLVEKRGEGFGGIGAPGLLTEHGGLAPLVWRGENAYFTGRGGFEQAASPQDVEKLRAFAADLAAALAC